MTVIRPAFLSVMTAGILLLSGCIVHTGPAMVKLEPPSGPPVLRLGSVNETFTGTWAGAARASGWGVRGYLINQLRQPEAAALFSDDPNNLVLQIDIVSDHDDDRAARALVIAVGIVTLGILPLTYDAAWCVDCTVSVLAADGSKVAQYPPFHVVGTYHCTALPWTWVSGPCVIARRADDGAAVMNRIANNIMSEILNTVAADYPVLAQRKAMNASL